MSEAVGSPAPSRSDPVLKAKLFRGLGDRSRLEILEVLRSGPTSVSAVVARTGLSQPNVSMHLACLWDCGLVERDRRGTQVIYRIERAAVVRLLETATGLIDVCGDRIGACRRYRANAPERTLRSPGRRDGGSATSTGGRSSKKRRATSRRPPRTIAAAVNGTELHAHKPKEE
jgi:ArsR family transcriptional regulator, cadmium/lead-responsive transcriptional repressor